MKIQIESKAISQRRSGWSASSCRQLASTSFCQICKASVSESYQVVIAWKLNAFRLLQVLVLRTSEARCKALYEEHLVLYIPLCEVIPLCSAPFAACTLSTNEIVAEHHGHCRHTLLPREIYDDKEHCCAIKSLQPALPRAVRGTLTACVGPTRVYRSLVSLHDGQYSHTGCADTDFA